MAIRGDKKATLSNHSAPLPCPHPVMKKYGFTIGDVHRMSLTLGIAPPTLFGILTGRILSNDILDGYIKKVVEPEDVDALRRDYNPLRHYQLLGEEYKDRYAVFQGYFAGKLRRGDAVLTDDDRWILISGVEPDGNMVRVFSRGVLVVSLRKNMMVTAAIMNGKPGSPVRVPLKSENDETRETNEDFFASINPGERPFNDIYQEIRSTISRKDIEGV